MVEKSSIPYGLTLVNYEQISGVLCGDFLEVTATPERVARGLKRPSPQKSKEPESEEELLQRSVSRSRRVVRQLCNTNRLYILHTLTFAVSHPEYFEGERPFDLVPLEFQRDREKVLELWKEFARKFRSYEASKGRVFRYIAVIEKHTGKRANGDKTIKRNTYHVHFLSDRIHGKRLLQAKWRHGLCNYADWTEGTRSQDMAENYDGKPPDNPGAYACKYLGKDMSSEYKGRKRYWASRTLVKPEKVCQEDVWALTYGKNPIFFFEKEIDFDGNKWVLRKATYYIERGDIGKDKVMLKQHKEIREDRIKKRIHGKELSLKIQKLRKQNEEKKSNEKSSPFKKQEHEPNLERPAILFGVPH